MDLNAVMNKIRTYTELILSEDSVFFLKQNAFFPTVFNWLLYMNIFNLNFWWNMNKQDLYERVDQVFFLL